MTTNHISEAVNHYNNIVEIRDLYADRFRQLSVCQQHILMQLSKVKNDREIALQRNICPELLLKEKKVILQASVFDVPKM